jgi:rhamnosyltransferase
MTSDVAIIIRSKNEMPYLISALYMLRKQTVQDVHLFVIDSGSIDGSLEEARKHCDREQITRIAPEAYVPGKVLNEAVARTECGIIVLLNGDAIPRSEDWLEKLIQPILQEGVDATYSRQVARSDAHFIVGYDYQRAYTPDKRVDSFFSAAACAFRRDLWARHQFQNDGYAEDAVWAKTCRRFNARFELVAESEVEHSHNYTLRNLFWKRYRHGVSFGSVLGETSTIGRRISLCTREILRDLIHTCRHGEFRTIPYNIAYRVTIHAGLHCGIRKGCR